MTHKFAGSCSFLDMVEDTMDERMEYTINIGINSGLFTIPDKTPAGQRVPTLQEARQLIWQRGVREYVIHELEKMLAQGWQYEYPAVEDFRVTQERSYNQFNDEWVTIITGDTYTCELTRPERLVGVNNELKIGQTDYDRLISEAKEAYPESVFGFLGGMDNQISSVYPLVFTTGSSGEPAFSAEELQRMADDFEKKGLELTGYYYSQPDVAAYPPLELIHSAIFQDSILILIGFWKSGKPDVVAFNIHADRQVTKRKLTVV